MMIYHLWVLFLTWSRRRLVIEEAFSRLGPPSRIYIFFLLVSCKHDSTCPIRHRWIGVWWTTLSHWLSELIIQFHIAHHMHSGHLCCARTFLEFGNGLLSSYFNIKQWPFPYFNVDMSTPDFTCPYRATRSTWSRSKLV